MASGLLLILLQHLADRYLSVSWMSAAAPWNHKSAHLLDSDQHLREKFPPSAHFKFIASGGDRAPRSFLSQSLHILSSVSPSSRYKLIILQVLAQKLQIKYRRKHEQPVGSCG